MEPNVDVVAVCEWCGKMETDLTYYFREIIDSEFLWRFSSIAWRKIQIIHPWKSYRTDSGLLALDCISEVKFWIPQRKSILTKNRNNIQLQLRELIFPKCAKIRKIFSHAKWLKFPALSKFLCQITYRFFFKNRTPSQNKLWNPPKYDFYFIIYSGDQFHFRLFNRSLFSTI